MLYNVSQYVSLSLCDRQRPFAYTQEAERLHGTCRATVADLGVGFSLSATMKTKIPASVRFWSKIRILENGCWERMPVKKDGYGQFGGMPAHRWSYTQYIGAIPDGLELDHLCKTRSCVNPIHLEPVTHSENMRRSGWNIGKELAMTDRAGNIRRGGVCANGHPATPENLYQWKHQSLCRVCRRENLRKNYITKHPNAKPRKHTWKTL